MVRALCFTVAVLLLCTGCVRGKPEAQPVPVAATPESPPESPKEDTAKAQPAPPPTAKAAPSPKAVPAPATKSTTAPSTKSTTGSPAKAPAAKTAAPANTPVAKGPPAPVPRTAVAPLDLDALKAQLKQTKAIGLMTKLSLKNKVDDLLDEFRAHHAGKPTPTMTELRRSYDLLMMKVLSLLQDHDQKLASDIVSSRERIWGLLADPRAFAALQA